jgi:lipopolysaccharide export system protein LptA
MKPRTPIIVAATVLATAASLSLPAPAQTKKDGPAQPSAFQGFARDNKDPVQIEADSFEVHDKDRYAVFIGNVVVKQGDSTMRARELKVHYEGSLRPSDRTAKAPPSAKSPTSNDPAQRIRRLEALGGVIITNKDQKATGDTGVLDMPTNTATITGNVVLTQGPNVMRADKLVVDLKSGFSRLESAAKGGQTRVQGLFVPSSVDSKKAGDQK